MSYVLYVQMCTFGYNFCIFTNYWQLRACVPCCAPCSASCMGLCMRYRCPDSCEVRMQERNVTLIKKDLLQINATIALINWK